MLAAANLNRQQWEALIDQWIFNERHRAILKRRLLDGVIYEDLQDEFDLSVRQLKTIVYKNQRELFKHL